MNRHAMDVLRCVGGPWDGRRVEVLASQNQVRLPVNLPTPADTGPKDAIELVYANYVRIRVCIGSDPVTPHDYLAPVA